MSVFKLLVGLCKDIEAMIQKFWWEQGESKNIHWVKWSTFCSSKSVGGMGFRDIQNYSNARQRLLYKVFSAKYFPNGNILEVSVHPRSSFAWRTILQARDVINKGAICRVDEGSIKIWEHNWLQDPSNNRVVSPQNNTNVLYVKELFFCR